MNASEASVFSAIAPYGQGDPQLQQGIRAAVAGAQKAEDIASNFGKTFDQSTLSTIAGMLLGVSPTDVTRSATLQVTRIPRAPFLALIILDLIYAIISTTLFVAGLIAVRKGDCVADAQARLSSKAVVAESFESPALGDDAEKVDKLFAERRGQKTRRVAIVRRDGGGRRFKQVFTAPAQSSRGPGSERKLTDGGPLLPG